MNIEVRNSTRRELQGRTIDIKLPKNTTITPLLQHSMIDKETDVGKPKKSRDNE